MIGVLQTNRQLPGGDCFRACVASIFERAIYEVPHFLYDSTGGPWRQEAWDRVRDWSKRFKAYPIHIDPETEPDKVKVLYDEKVFYIATGPSPGFPDLGHCVVGLAGELVFDPFDGGTVPSKMLAGPPWLLIAFVSE